jgi:hypothetical protein
VAWVVADLARGAGFTVMTLSEEVTGLGVKSLSWPASLPAEVLPLAGSPLQILGIRMEITTTSTAGNRRPSIEVQDLGLDLVQLATSSSVVAASTSLIFEFWPGHRVDNTFELAGTVVRASMPRGLRIYPGRQISLLDENVVDTADTMVVHVRARVRER